MKETTGVPAPAGRDRITGGLGEVFDLVGPLYRRAWRRLEQDESGGGMPVGVRAVLTVLRDRGPMTVPDMGRALSLSRQFVQRTVNDATERGLVEAVPNPAHKKSSLIQVTDEGRSALTAVLERERAMLSRAADDLSEADVDACVRVLSRLVRLLDEDDQQG